MWRRIWVFHRRTPTNERPETLPTAVGVMVGVDCISDMSFLYRTSRTFSLAIEKFFRPIGDSSAIENSPISKSRAREDLKRLCQLMVRASS